MSDSPLLLGTDGHVAQYDLDSDPDKRSRKQRASALEPIKQLHGRRRRHSPDDAARALHRHQDPVLVSKEHEAAVAQGEPVPPARRLRAKSKTWSRVSSLLPPLMSPSADAQTPPARRKPASPSVSPTDRPLPPPPGDHDQSVTDLPSDTIGMAISDMDSPTPQQASSPVALALRKSPTLASMADADVGTLSISSSDSHQLTASTTPSSPASRRATATGQEAAAPAGTQARSGAASADNSPEGSVKHQAKLHKSSRRSSRRSLSSPNRKPLPADAQPNSRPQSPLSDQRGRRSVSARTMSIVTDASPIPRVTSTPATPRPRSSRKDSQSPSRGRIRRSWLPGSGRSRSSSADAINANKPYAWVISDDANQAEYNPSFLKNGEKVPELWNENGTVYVFLYPRASGCGPSFKVPDFTVSNSYVFNELIQSELESSHARSRARSFGGRESLSAYDAARFASPPISPSPPESLDGMRLYIPAAPPTASGHLTAPRQGSHAELDRLIAIRNLFAFLTGQPLVGTKSRPTTFHAFLEIADLLQEFGFSGQGGETFGEAVDLSFGFYSDQLGLADCRHSRERTLEALILGERMRSLDLYSEAFAHAAGKYSAIMDLRLPLFQQVSPHTRERLERAYLDLVNRQHNVNEHLEQFEFPSLFAGIANSTSIPELRQVRFKVWRSSFGKMRHFILGYYKTAFGNWPPKASSKKNPFAESGLNRLVLKVLYSDMCALYDLLVDRTNLTSRVIDEVPAISDEADKMTTSALRNIMSEFDRSKPPVLPPVPFDLPRLPSVTAIHETFNSLSAKEQNRFEKSIKQHELLLILNKAYNYDVNSTKLPFLNQFKQFELREAKGKMGQDLVDQRIGYWLFLYVVLQSLPMLVVDAPGLSYTEGVEYFLCEPPMGNPPWVEDQQVRKMWYEITGGGGRLVELSADAVMFSVEATYHRSHCWLAAQKWEGTGGADAPPPEEPGLSPLMPPPSVFPTGDDYAASPPPAATGTPSPPPGAPPPALRPRTLSPGVNRASHAWRSSIAIGLEPVPMEPPALPDIHGRSNSLGLRPPSSHLGSRSVSMVNLAALAPKPAPPAATSGATFDQILADTEKPAEPKKKKRFF